MSDHALLVAGLILLLFIAIVVFTALLRGRL
jgi:hypothetical protein